jgi:hypothetical protein
MLTPGLPTRMKHRHPLAGIWIDPINLDALVFVTSAAGQPQIVLVRRAPTREGNDVFNGQGLTGNEDGRTTIATAVAYLPSQSDEQLRGQVTAIRVGVLTQLTRAYIRHAI